MNFQSYRFTKYLPQKHHYIRPKQTEPRKFEFQKELDALF